MQEIRKKQVLEYVVLPGIIPRLKELFGTGFSAISALMAVILQSVKLLPDNHPYLSPENYGKFGIRHVFAEAGNRLVFDRKHLDQIAIFFTLVAGFILLIFQFVMLVISMIATPVLASMFQTANPDFDIAFMLMDMVFGVPNMFQSCVEQTIACRDGQIAIPAFPSPFHNALQNLFQYFSLAMLIAGIFIFLYYVLVVIAETAQTGTPFGKRFAHVWAPIRLVVALGLLVPVNYGYNSGQYIVLFAAKMGSGFATNGWLLYNSTLTNALGVEDQSLFIRPKVPDTWPLVKFMLLVRTCAESYSRVASNAAGTARINIQPYYIRSPDNGVQVPMAGPNRYQEAVDFYNKGDVIIRFGEFDIDPTSGNRMYENEIGGVMPFCGEIVIPTTVAEDTGLMVGPWQVQEGYFNVIRFLWNTPGAIEFSQIMAHRALSFGGCNVATAAYFNPPDCDREVDPEILSQMRNDRQSLFDAAVGSARTNMIAAATATGALAVPTAVLERGWAGAGIWYNTLAEINGPFSSAATLLPVPSRLPVPMEHILAERKKHNQSAPPSEMFSMVLAGNIPIEFGSDINKQVAGVLSYAYGILGKDDVHAESPTTRKGSIFEDLIGVIFGLNGLFTMRENADIHPLAQLIGLGKGIVDSSIRNMFIATPFAAGGGVLMGLSGSTSPGLLGFFASVASSTATIGLTTGFLLYYVLPFLPFIYFFFAVGAWVKTVFEAMVGVPLWALAHLRIDGQGLPGENAMNGYFMILEIFLRPILTVFGLIGSMIIFAALVKVLNEIFDLVTSNLSGFDYNACPGDDCTKTGSTIVTSPTNKAVIDMMEFKRSRIDEFFFTIVYAIVVYMLATSSFKMIDLVPKGILRWLGAGAKVFSDQIADPTEGLKRYVVMGGYSMTNQLVGGITQSAQRLGQGLGAARAHKSGGPAAGTGTGPAPGAGP